MTASSRTEFERVAPASTTLAQKVASATDPTRSLLGRIGDTASAIQLATRVLPAGWRLLKRNPVRYSLVILALACVAYALRPPHASTHR